MMTDQVNVHVQSIAAAFERAIPEFAYYAMAMLIKPAYIQLEINDFHLTDTTGQRLNALSDLLLAIEEGRWPHITNQQETNA